jgi:hypothetical protein
MNTGFAPTEAQAAAMLPAATAFTCSATGSSSSAPSTSV